MERGMVDGSVSLPQWPNQPLLGLASPDTRHSTYTARHIPAALPAINPPTRVYRQHRQPAHIHSYTQSKANKNCLCSSISVALIINECREGWVCLRWMGLAVLQCPRPVCPRHTPLSHSSADTSPNTGPPCSPQP